MSDFRDFRLILAILANFSDFWKNLVSWLDEFANPRKITYEQRSRPEMTQINLDFDSTCTDGACFWPKIAIFGVFYPYFWHKLADFDLFSL